MLFSDIGLTEAFDSNHVLFLAFGETADVVSIWLFFATLHFCLNLVCRWNFSHGNRNLVVAAQAAYSQSAGRKNIPDMHSQTCHACRYSAKRSTYAWPGVPYAHLHIHVMHVHVRRSQTHFLPDGPDDSDMTAFNPTSTNDSNELTTLMNAALPSGRRYSQCEQLARRSQVNA